MEDNHNKKREKRKLTKVRGYPGIFKIWIWSEGKNRFVEPKTIKGSQAKGYRAVRRVKVLGKMVQQARNFQTVEDARSWRMGVSPEIPIPEKKSDTYVLKNLIEDWREWSKPPRLTESTWEIYAKDIRHFQVLHDIPVEELTAEHVDLWLKSCIDPSYPKNPARVSFSRELTALTTVLNWYREYKNAQYQPSILKRHRRDCFFKPKSPRQDLSLSVEDAERFLDRLRNHHRPVYFYLASFQALTGARIGEACGLKWDCVDLENSTVEIKRICWWLWRDRKPSLREGTKTGDERIVVIPPRLVQLLREWKETGSDGELVFHLDGNLMRYPGVQNAYKKAYQALGLPNRSTHVMRHTFASIYSDQTSDIRGTQAALGHRDPRVTQHYAKVAERTQRRSVEKFDFGKIPSADGPPPSEGAKVISLAQRGK